MYVVVPPATVTTVGAPPSSGLLYSTSYEVTGRPCADGASHCRTSAPRFSSSDAVGEIVGCCGALGSA